MKPFPKCVSANPKEIEVAMAMPCSGVMFEKRALHKYVHVDTFIHM